MAKIKDFLTAAEIEICTMTLFPRADDGVVLKPKAALAEIETAYESGFDGCEEHFKKTFNTSYAEVMSKIRSIPADVWKKTLNKWCEKWEGQECHHFWL